MKTAVKQKTFFEHRTLRVEGDEIRFFIEQHALAGSGLALIDVDLLAASKMSAHPLWTKDKRLKAAADTLGLVFGHPEN